MSEVPTLLVGLGGIGSKVADMICGWLPPDKRKKVALYAFDTNVNDISNLQYLKGRITQTSTDLTVEGYLHRSDPSVREWFPYNCSVLLRKPLTNGAGQIRVVSRLAYRSALERGKLAEFERYITKLFMEKGEEFESSIRVIIISSLSGGTGSGMFLQVAMYLRELFETRFSRQDVLIRGAFLLPDCLIKTGLLDRTEHNNIKANAYAALKELDAITRISSGHGQNLATIELEYKPGQRDVYGKVNYAITEKQLPFDYVFLYDFENTEGNNISYFDNYLNQMAKTIYLQVFSPMAPQHFSVEDNQILNLISNEGRSRYGGAGVASLVYPFEDIVKYCALKWTTENLSEKWLKIDEQYREEIRAYERDLKDGIYRERPRLPERYISILENFASDEKADSFFRNIHWSTKIRDERGRYESAKSDLFLAAVDREIERVIEEDRDLKDLEEECKVDEAMLKNKDHAPSEVARREDNLEYLKREVMKAVREHSIFLINQIVTRDCDERGCSGGQEYRLNTWMLSKPEPLHPVAVRYVLYQIHLELNARLNELRVRNENLLLDIEAYKRAYDIDETEDIESAEDRLRIALNQGFLKALFHNEFKEFVKLYMDKASFQLNNLITYKLEKLKELVYSGILDAINNMIEDWERYFRNLRDVKNNLTNEMNLLAKKHEETADPSTIYVLGKKEHKDYLWDNIRTSVTGDSLPKEIAKRIYLGQYGRFCKRRLKEFVLEEERESVEKMFQDDVLSWCIKQLRQEDSLNRNIFSALRVQAGLEGKDDTSYIKETIETVARTAKPFVPDVRETRHIYFWGIHPDSLKELEEDKKQSLFDNELIEDEAFSPYEVIRYCSQYGMTVFDFPKFSAGDSSRGILPGDYYTAYVERIKDLDTNPNVITPHLDKRWHREAYLPDLNPREVERRENEIDRSFILGFIYRYFEAVEQDKEWIWCFHGENRTSSVKRDGVDISSKLHLLHEGLFFNPSVVDQVHAMATRQKERDKKQFNDISEHAFYKGCLTVGRKEPSENIVNLVLRYPSEVSGVQNIYATCDRLLEVLLDEIIGYFVYCYGEQRKNTAIVEARNFIKSLVENSDIYKNADRDNIVFRSWENIISRKMD